MTQVVNAYICVLIAINFWSAVRSFFLCCLSEGLQPLLLCNLLGHIGGVCLSISK